MILSGNARGQHVTERSLVALGVSIDGSGGNECISLTLIFESQHLLISYHVFNA